MLTRLMDRQMDGWMDRVIPMYPKALFLKSIKRNKKVLFYIYG